MSTPKRANARPAPVAPVATQLKGEAANEWSELAHRWQDVAAQWTQLWTDAALGKMRSVPASLQPPDMVSRMPAVSIDPAAATQLTERYTRRFEELWAHAAEGRAGPAQAHGPADRRFSDKAWREHPYFAWLRDAYLLYAEYVRELAALAQTDDATKRRLVFLAQQYVDAISPSNFLATNPEAMQRALATGGTSIAQGLSNLVSDAQRGRIAMTDESAFEVGRNLATTPGSVVYRNPLIELIQYAPTTPEVAKRPLLIVPPCINKYYILDLQPENSFVRYAVGQGHTVFMVSWRNIPAELGGLAWDDYIEQGVLAALDAAREIAVSKTVNALGFCIGGTLLACALAVLAARQEAPVASATLLATMLDFADPGDIGVYVSREGLAARMPALCGGGRIQGGELASAFASLRPNELVWNYVVGNYLKGQTPPAFDLLYWNGDSANLPGPMYVEYLRDMYLDNRLREPDALSMCGQPIDLKRITMPSYILAAREDHIVPWRTAYKSVALLGGEPTFVLGASGHIAGVINPPGKNRRNFWTNELLTDDPDDWLVRARTHPGSWWPHWAAWLNDYTGGFRPAPKAPGSDKHRPLSPAPGTYVIERVT
ncbi:MAG TPA: class I poly(R)-hydroxyalkanoic acid synthase [Casimicrobiaceae bacterium]|nr:class I poly(R)-hydroxyalkanoic acid synthase [Casimicrobiaceae bacterium]